MKITKDVLKQLIKQQLNEQYVDDMHADIVGPPQEEEPDPMDPENQWFKDPGTPVGAGGGPYKPDYGSKGRPMQGNLPGMPNPIKDGIYPIQTPEGPRWEWWVYNEPKYKEYFDFIDREKKRFKKGFPGKLHRAGPDIRKDDQYVPGYQRSRPPMAESKKGDFKNMKITKQRLKELIKEELENMSFLEEEFVVEDYEEKREEWKFKVSDMKPRHKKIAVEAGYSLSSVLKAVGNEPMTEKEALKQIMRRLMRQRRPRR
jgi:hypothetical protein